MHFPPIFPQTVPPKIEGTWAPSHWGISYQRERNKSPGPLGLGLWMRKPRAGRHAWEHLLRGGRAPQGQPRGDLVPSWQAQQAGQSPLCQALGAIQGHAPHSGAHTRERPSEGAAALQCQVPSSPRRGRFGSSGSQTLLRHKRRSWKVGCEMPRLRFGSSQFISAAGSSSGGATAFPRPPSSSWALAERKEELTLNQGRPTITNTATAPSPSAGKN